MHRVQSIVIATRTARTLGALAFGFAFGFGFAAAFAFAAAFGFEVLLAIAVRRDSAPHL